MLGAREWMNSVSSVVSLAKYLENGDINSCCSQEDLVLNKKFETADSEVSGSVYSSYCIDTRHTYFKKM